MKILITISCFIVLLSVTVYSQPIYPAINNDADMDRHLYLLSNWGNWGNKDESGTLNYISSLQTLKAAKLVKQGVAISLARPVMISNPSGMRNWKYEMQKHSSGSRDHIGAVWHGYYQTHMDALCHVYSSDSLKMYNGFSTALVDSNGCNRLSIAVIAEKGITGRAVLIDMVLLNGRSMLAGESVKIMDIEKALALEKITMEEGDIILLRTGAGTKNTREGRAGFHPECLFYFKQKKVAVIGSDGDNDVYPLPGFKKWEGAIHSIGIPYLGIPLIDNAELEQLGQECKARKQYAFFITIAPWKIWGATSSPVNPIAVF